MSESKRGIIRRQGRSRWTVTYSSLSGQLSCLAGSEFYSLFMPTQTCCVETVTHLVLEKSPMEEI